MYRVGDVIVAELIRPATVMVPELAVKEPPVDIDVITSSSDVVIAAKDVIPRTVRVPALLVMDPSATIDVVAVTVDILASPFMVNVPLLAVIEPRWEVVM